MSSEVQVLEVRRNHLEARSLWPPPSRLVYATYVLALLASVSVWFIAIRAPLYLDETGTYWMIKDGFSLIWAHRYFGLPVYFYILWLATKIIGTSEVALRIPSLLAMLGAVYLLYRAARELFDRDTALLAAVIFCVHPIIIFASINVRPYGFVELVTNSAILLLLRLRKSESNGMAALFGLSAAFILYFHFLSGAILPALFVCFFLAKAGDRKALWRQFGWAFGAFALACLPLIPALLDLVRTRSTHVYEGPPKLSRLVWTLAPSWLPFVFAGTALVALVVAALTTRPGEAKPRNVDATDWRAAAICLSLALIPLLFLYGVSAGTSTHMFADIHRTVTVSGIALCWALVFSRFRPAIRLLFCLTIVAVTAVSSFRSSDSREPEHTWKYALQAVERNALTDGAPVIVCSHFPESDFVSMPLDSPKTSRYFTPLSYYKISVPVIPLPLHLNDEAIRVGSKFLQEATQKHERFLALADEPSYKTLQWLSQRASGAYEVRKVGVFQETEVLEFDPRSQ